MFKYQNHVTFPKGKYESRKKNKGVGSKIGVVRPGDCE